MMSSRSRHASRASHSDSAGAKYRMQGRVPCYLCMTGMLRHTSTRRAEAVTWVSGLRLPVIRLEVPAPSVSSPSSPISSVPKAPLFPQRFLCRQSVEVEGQVNKPSPAMSLAVARRNARPTHNLQGYQSQ